MEYAVLSCNTAGSYDTKTETNIISDQSQRKSLDYKLTEAEVIVAGMYVVGALVLKIGILFLVYITIFNIDT